MFTFFKVIIYFHRIFLSAFHVICLSLLYVCESCFILRHNVFFHSI